MHRPPLPPGNIPGTHFCQRLSQPQGHSATGRVMSMNNSNDTIGNRTRDLPTCSAVSQPTAPQHTPPFKRYIMTLSLKPLYFPSKFQFESQSHSLAKSTCQLCSTVRMLFCENCHSQTMQSRHQQLFHVLNVRQFLCTPQRHGGRRGIAPLILNLDSKQS